MNSGLLYALGAYVVWGILPIYWKSVQHVPAIQIAGHRIVWSFIVLMVYIFLTRQWDRFRSTLNRRVSFIYLSTGILLSVNWLIYVWAVNAGYIVETSLGYFINPLFSVVLGMLFLDERLRPAQWIPVGLATCGVVYLTWAYGSIPWIALALAISFGFYGLVKKIAPLGSLYGLTLETGFVFLPALIFLVMVDFNDQGAFMHNGLQTDALLIGAGIVTIIPLLLFTAAAKRITLTMVGIMQYIAPTLQFLIGVFIYNEAFTAAKLIGFTMVWIALILFWLEGIVARRRTKFTSP